MINCSCAHSVWTHDCRLCGWVRHSRSHCFQLGTLVSRRMPKQWWGEVSVRDDRRTSSSPAWKSRLGKGEQLLKKAAEFFAKGIDSWHIVSLINISSSSDRDGFLISCTSTQTQITTTSEMLMRIISLKNLIIVNGFKHFQFSYPTHRMSNTMANAVKRRIGLPFL